MVVRWVYVKVDLWVVEMAASTVGLWGHARVDQSAFETVDVKADQSVAYSAAYSAGYLALVKAGSLECESAASWAVMKAEMKAD